MIGSHGLSAGQKVRMSVLGAGGETEEAQVVAVSATDAAMWGTRPIPLDTALRIDAGDAMLLGEVVSCRKGDGVYAINVHLSQIIPSLSDLGRIVSAVMCETPRAADTRGWRARAVRQSGGPRPASE